MEYRINLCSKIDYKFVIALQRTPSFVYIDAKPDRTNEQNKAF